MLHGHATKRNMTDCFSYENKAMKGESQRLMHLMAEMDV